MAGVANSGRDGRVASTDSRDQEVSRKAIPRSITPASLGELALMPADDLAAQDIALMNLRCAQGLPGAEDLDMEKCLSLLDQWSERVQQETQKHLGQFVSDPARFDHSESIYRLMMLVTVLQQDFGVHYNPDKIGSKIDFSDAKDLFIHGMLGCDNGGTCVSMPVLYTAIGRRLGYPLFLVNAKKHLFCRWEDSSERFNIEATNEGMNTYEDEHYRTWPAVITDREVADGHFLKSLDPAETLAVFLASRGHCQEDNLRYADARASYALAHRNAPRQPMYRSFLSQLLRSRTLRDFPQIAEQQRRLQRRLNRTHFPQPAFVPSPDPLVGAPGVPFP